MSLDGVYSGPLKAEKDSEFHCPRCHSRCTESPIDGTEYGHKEGCPRREIDQPTNGASYDPEDDPLAQPEESDSEDGGDRRVD